ncbi:GntR family transcriptional regulator [Flammeovirga pacifica]|uniref:HTH gntR-type domain-containing protein n=1 Tax=Flammeovirga pacifica TaxID=915059 RepID=A0A1S1YSA3_FLAPC|nr:GntR family transcriptional regulator [Flammeovirga pacifica]OHX63907.1 hypothetical protein NH26_20050 [Flammeovirga pacifica]
MENLIGQLHKQLGDVKCQHHPKYIQIAKSFKNLINLGHLQAHAKMPSINDLVMELELSKDTVEKSYSILKRESYILTQRGKGTFVNHGFDINVPKVLLIFNKMSASKEKIFKAFLQTSGEHLQVDLLLHNYSVKSLERIIDEQENNYNYFVIIPIFKDANEEETKKVIERLPASKTLLLNKKLPTLPKFQSVYEDFSEDIYQVLSKNIVKLFKYNQLELIAPKGENRIFNQIRSGFVRCCLHYDITFKVSSVYQNEELHENTAYILVDDQDLATIISDCRSKKLRIGEQIGLISYNDTPLKAILEEGITVITTSFENMGKTAAQQILHKKLANHKVDFKMIQRASFVGVE